MKDGIYVYARAWGSVTRRGADRRHGRVLHVVCYALPPEGETRRARCGFVPRHGWGLLVSSTRPDEARCRRCAEREG
jgi:hypothetical protein